MLKPLRFITKGKITVYLAENIVKTYIRNAS
jgi:hypothetical protein